MDHPQGIFLEVRSPTWKMRLRSGLQCRIQNVDMLLPFWTPQPCFLQSGGLVHQEWSILDPLPRCGTQWTDNSHLSVWAGLFMFLAGQTQRKCVQIFRRDHLHSLQKIDTTNSSPKQAATVRHTFHQTMLTSRSSPQAKTGEFAYSIRWWLSGRIYAMHLGLSNTCQLRYHNEVRKVTASNLL